MKTNVPVTAAAGVILAFLGASARGAIIAGPYLQKVDTDRMTVMWETDSAGDSYVDYGPTSGYGQVAGQAESVTLHEVEVTGLSADTEYHYRARTGGTNSSDAVFRTSPPKGSTNFRFLAYGDSRTNQWTHTEVALAIGNAVSRTFVLNSGDIVPASSSNPPLFREDFFGPIMAYCRETPVFVGRGNHEATNPNFVQYLAHPTTSSGNEDYYSFNYGNVHVIGMDTNQSYADGSAQETWLENDLQIASADSDIDWIVAAFHTPPYSTGSVHGSHTGIRNAWSPHFENYGVDLVFNGDDHTYERVQERNGVVYIVTGGGGADLYDQGTPESWSVCFHKVNNFVTIDVTDTALTVIGHCVRNPGRGDGDLLDSVVITKSPQAWSPTALAGPDQAVDEGTSVTLDGRGSYDGDGDAFTYAWSQISGPATVTLSNANAAQPSFTPSVSGVYVLQLVCTEGGTLDSVPDKVRIGVKSPATGGQHSVNPVADTYIDAALPAQNFGSSQELNVDGDGPWAMSYLRFDVPAFEGVAVEAKLRLYCVNNSDYGGYVRTFSDTAWSENSPTYDSPLNVDGPVVGVFGIVDTSQWVEVDVTPAFDGVSGPVSMSLAVCPSSGNGADYASRESSNPPELIVDYSGATTQTPTCSILPYETPILQGATVDFDSTAVAPDGGAILSYEWDYDYDGTTFDVDGTGQQVSHVFAAAGTFTVALRVTDDESQTALATIEIVVVADADGDGMPDWWEQKYGLNPDNASDADQDLDGDNLPNLEEYQLGTDPTDADTDGDGVNDDVDADPLQAPDPFHGTGGGCGCTGVAAAVLFLALVRRKEEER